MRENDFNRLLKALNHEKLDEPVLFEYVINNMEILNKLAGYAIADDATEIEKLTHSTKAYAAAGYDYVIYTPEDFSFHHKKIHKGKSISMNEGAEITDMESFRKFPWPDPNNSDFSILQKADTILPEKMKIILRAPLGVLANTQLFCGYENLCLFTYDDPDLIKAVCDAIGERLYEYYRICLSYDRVGAVFYNDDWGFTSGLMFSIDFFKVYIFPWVKKFTDLIHRNGRPALIHSCGRVDLLMDYIVDDLKFDARHSFEDKIMPIEEAYKLYGERIAMLGGIDVDFLCRAPKEEIYQRCKNMLSLGKKGYALGSGNSIPPYVPVDSYFAMMSAAGLQV